MNLRDNEAVLSSEWVATMVFCLGWITSALTFLKIMPSQLLIRAYTIPKIKAVWCINASQLVLDVIYLYRSITLAFFLISNWFLTLCFCYLAALLKCQAKFNGVNNTLWPLRETQRSLSCCFGLAAFYSDIQISTVENWNAWFVGNYCRHQQDFFFFTNSVRHVFMRFSFLFFYWVVWLTYVVWVRLPV